MAPRRPRAARLFMAASLLTVPALVALATVGERLFLPDGAGEGLREQALEDHRAAVAAGLALYVLFGLGAVIYTRRRPLRWLLPGLVLWWLALETWAAPYWVRHLGLRQYYVVTDPDHRPTQTTWGFNSDALRGTPEPEQFTSETFNLLFLGDSFTYGMRLKSPREAFPQVFGRSFTRAHPRVPLRVANFGWTSSSPLLAYRRLLDVGEDYEPDVVVYCVDMTDFMDAWRSAGLIERRGLYEWYDRIPMLLRLMDYSVPRLYAKLVAWSAGEPSAQRFYVTEAPLEETLPAFEPIVADLERLRSWSAERGADFVTVLLPRSYQISARECPDNWEADQYEVLGPHCLVPFQFFEQREQELGYPVLSLLDDFRDEAVIPTSLEDDPHWTPHGHEVAAEALMRKLSPLLLERLDRR